MPTDAFQSTIDGGQNNNLALIAQSMQTIQRDIAELKADVREQMRDHEMRLRKLELERIPALEQSQSDLAATVKSWQWVQAGYSTIAAVAAGVSAAIFGSNRG